MRSVYTASIIFILSIILVVTGFLYNYRGSVTSVPPSIPELHLNVDRGRNLGSTVYSTVLNPTDIKSQSKVVENTDGNDMLLGQFTDQIDALVKNGIQYELLSTQPIWSGDQANKLKPGRLPPTSTILKAVDEKTKTLHWVIPIDATHIESFNGNLLLLRLGHNAEVNIIDASTGSFHQRIKLTNMPVGDYPDGIYPQWGSFLEHSFTKKTGELFLLGRAISAKQDENIAGREHEYYVVKYTVARTVREWLANPQSAQWAGYEYFNWKSPIEYPHIIDLVSGKGFVVITNEFSDMNNGHRALSTDLEELHFLKIDASTGNPQGSAVMHRVNMDLLSHFFSDGQSIILQNKNGHRNTVGNWKKTQ